MNTAANLGGSAGRRIVSVESILWDVLASLLPIRILLLLPSMYGLIHHVSMFPCFRHGVFSIVYSLHT